MPSPPRATAAPGRLLVLAVPERQHVDVLVAGHADRATAQHLRERLVDALFYRPRSLAVDATDVTSCDLSGLYALVDAVAVMKRSGVHVTVQPSPRLARLMADVRRTPQTSGRPAPDPAGCPLPRPSRAAVQFRAPLTAARRRPPTTVPTDSRRPRV